MQENTFQNKPRLTQVLTYPPRGLDLRFTCSAIETCQIYALEPCPLLQTASAMLFFLDLVSCVFFPANAAQTVACVRLHGPAQQGEIHAELFDIAVALSARIWMSVARNKSKFNTENRVSRDFAKQTSPSVPK